MAARKDNKGRALRKGEIYRESDNRYAYGYTDPYGNRRFIYSKDLKKLREREEKLIKDQLDGLDVYVAGNADLNFVFDRYISTKSELRETTYTNYTYMYNRFVRDGFGKKKIGEIKYSDVLYFYYDLLNEKKIQINTLETIHTVLHPTFQLAVRDDIIRNNPSDRVMAEIKKKGGKNKGVRHALTLEQQRAFMNYVATSPVFNHWSPFFTLLLGTGCRIGEVVGLRWEDVDMESRVIDVNHSMTYYPRRTDTYKCEFKVSLPKTNAGNRKIPIMQPVYDALQSEYERQKEEGFCSSVVDGMTGFIFTNRFKTIHNPSAVNRAIRRILEAHNAEEIVIAKKEKRLPIIIPHFSCHHLRHTFCSRFCENETNLKIIQTVMGHASIETTMDIYAEIDGSIYNETDIADTINKLFNGQPEEIMEFWGINDEVPDHHPPIETYSAADFEENWKSYFMSKEQMEYAAYSLTGKHISFDSIDSNLWVDGTYVGFGGSAGDITWNELRNYSVDVIGNNTYRVSADVWYFCWSDYYATQEEWKVGTITFLIKGNADSCYDGFSLLAVESVDIETTEWKTAYRELISEMFGDSSEIQYSLIHLNNDGVCELLVERDCIIDVYTYDAGNVYKMIDGWSPGAHTYYYGYLPYSNAICEAISGQPGADDPYHTVIFTDFYPLEYVNGVATTGRCTDSLIIYMGDAYTLYQLNGNDITQEQYDEYLRPYKDLVGDLGYYEVMWFLDADLW